MYGISIVPQKPLAGSQDFTKCFQPHNVPMPTEVWSGWKTRNSEYKIFTSMCPQDASIRLWAESVS